MKAKMRIVSALGLLVAAGVLYTAEIQANAPVAAQVTPEKKI